MKKALILLGCPESPSQTPLAIYCGYALGKKGYDVTFACNPSAAKLLEVSDPEKHYFKKHLNIDKCLDNLEESAYDLLIGFAHKDAAVSYFVTFYHIIQSKAIALVFEKDQDLVNQFESTIAESTDATIVSARAFHNPTPIRVKIDKALEKLWGFIMSFCLETYLNQSEDYTILASRTGFKEVKKIIEDNSNEIIYINPGEKILGVRMIGVPPIPIGINTSKGTIILPYTKPCYGTAAVVLPLSSDDIDNIRKVAIKN